MAQSESGGVISFSAKTPWPESLEFKLLTGVQTHKCHLATDVAKYEKWARLLQMLSCDEEFIGRSSTAKNLEVKYKRVVERIARKFERAKLSGLSVNASPLETLALDLVKQKHDAEGTTNERRRSFPKKQRSMLAHQNAILRTGPPSKARVPTTEPFHQNLQEIALDPESSTNSISLDSEGLSTPSPKNSISSHYFDWEAEREFLDYLISQIEERFVYHSELELELSKAATAKIVAETAKIEAQCKLLKLQSRKRCRDQDPVELDSHDET
jgi:hypothetical protein